MVLDNDEFLIAQEELAETLAAARQTLEILAASALPFAAQARIRRESSRLARAWVLEHVDLTPFPAIPADFARAPDRLPVQHVDLVDPQEDDLDPHTEEVNRETGEAADEFDEADGSDLVAFQDDVGSEVGADDLADSGIETRSLDDLVRFDDDTIGDDDALEHAESASDQEIEDLIAYDDGFEVDVDGSLGLADEESIGDDPSPADLSSLVVFDDEQPMVTLGGDERSRKATPAPEPRLARERADDEDSLHDGTLVTDLDELVKLEDLLQEESAAEAARRASTPRGPEPRAVGSQDQKVRVATTLTDEDLGLLGFNSQRELLSPEGSDADPASETGSRKAIPVPRAPRRDDDRSIEPIAGYGAPAAKAPAAVAVSSGTATPGPARSLGALPTIRDQAERPAANTARAAIRLEPGGKGTVVQPADDLLALDGADDDDGGGNGFSIEVEEYEFIEEDEIEVEPDPPPSPGRPGGSAQVSLSAAPSAPPKLTTDQRQILAKTARSAADRGDFSTAANLYADILDYDPDYVPALVGRGRAYLDLGDYARAMSDFTVAADLAPDDPDTNAAIGKLYYDRKDYTRAIDYFDRTLKRDAKHAMAWCWRGIAQYYRKDYPAAYDDLVHAQKLDGSIPNIGTYIAMVKKKRK